ncbi:hypothetical protein HDZ31DRAFT_69805 [Schizophyllum fasciatum]
MLLPAAHILALPEPNCQSEPHFSTLTPVPALPTTSETADEMAPTELALGITIYVPGKLPTIQDSQVAAQSLADPRNCTRLVSKICAYAKASNLADGAFMDSAANVFESTKMLSDFHQAAACLEIPLSTITFAQLETVLKAAFMCDSTIALVNKFLFKAQ